MGLAEAAMRHLFAWGSGLFIALSIGYHTYHGLHDLHMPETRLEYLFAAMIVVASIVAAREVVERILHLFGKDNVGGFFLSGASVFLPFVVYPFLFFLLQLAFDQQAAWKILLISPAALLLALMFVVIGSTLSDDEPPPIRTYEPDEDLFQRQDRIEAQKAYEEKLAKETPQERRERENRIEDLKKFKDEYARRPRDFRGSIMFDR